MESNKVKWYVRAIYYDSFRYVKTEVVSFDYHRLAKEYYLKFIKDHQVLLEDFIIGVSLFSIVYDRTNDRFDSHIFVAPIIFIAFSIIFILLL